MPETFGERLKKIRINRNLSQDEFATLLGTSKQVISRYENNLRSPKVSIANNFAKKLNISMDFLLSGEETSSFGQDWLKDNAIPYIPGKRIPIVGTIKAGYNGIALECIDGFDYADVANPDEYIFLRIKGDSMEPKISDGDLALIKKQSDVDSGDVAAVIINGFEGTLKRVIKQGQSIVLQAFNNAYAPQIIAGEDLDDFMIVGKVIETKRKW